MMHISNLYSAFSIEFKAESEIGIVTIHPEMRPIKTGIAPTLRYHVYGIHPIHASFTLIIERFSYK